MVQSMPAQGGGQDPAVWNQALPWQEGITTEPPQPPAPKGAPTVEVPPVAGIQPAGESRSQRWDWAWMRTWGAGLTMHPLWTRRTLLRATLGAAVILLVTLSILVSQHVGSLADTAPASSPARSAAPLAGPPVIPLPSDTPDANLLPELPMAPPPSQSPVAPPQVPAKAGHANSGSGAGNSVGSGGSGGGGGKTSSTHTSPAKPAVPKKPAAPPPATIVATGHVTCLSGSAVVGVWVVGRAGGSGWAAWTSTASSPGYASFNKKISNGAWEVHVGCGGSPPSWKVATYSGWVSGTPHDFTCDDIPGQGRYGECWI